MARAYLSHVALDGARVLAGASEVEFASLLDTLVDLPALDLSLHVELPKLVSPELASLYDAVGADDEDNAEGALGEVVRSIDTPLERLASPGL